MARVPKPLHRDELIRFLGNHRSVRQMESMMGAVETMDQDFIRQDLLTARGDLIYRGPTVPARLPIGTADQILGTNGIDPAWVTKSPVITLGTDLSGSVTLTNLGNGTLNATISSNAVTNAKLADMAQATIKGRAAGAGTGDPSDLTASEVAAIVASAVAAALNDDSGTYTPTLTNGTNIDSSTAFLSRYIRRGSQVFVSGVVNVDCTAAAGTASDVGISLPIASNFGSLIDCAGVCAANGILQAGAILADIGNDRAVMFFASQSTAVQSMWFQFGYTII